MSSIKDVARLAGVSISTVSRVLNDTCPVSGDKRQRVLTAASELDYTPNPAARSLLLRRTRALGVVIPFASGEFFSEFLTGIDQTASDRDHFLLISISHRSASDLRKAIHNLDKRVDGMIVWAPEMEGPHIKSLVEESTPVLLVNTFTDDGASDFIDFDNYGGMSKVVNYLIDLGHREIAFVGGPSAAVDAQKRRKAYRDIMAARNLSPRPDLEFEGNFTVEDGYAAAHRVLAATPRPTAIVASNDLSAFGVLRGLREAGVDVPGHISVTGFDDVPSSTYCHPPLTTARVPVRKIGELAINALVDRIEEKRVSANRRTLDVDLVIRQSTGPPPQAT